MVNIYFIDVSNVKFYSKLLSCGCLQLWFSEHKSQVLLRMNSSYFNGNKILRSRHNRKYLMFVPGAYTIAFH